MSTTEEIRKNIDEIRFTLISPSETRRLSAVEIQAADTYDEDGVPIVSGLMDGRLGTLEPRQKCRTCGNTAVACPGHSGHIELAEPVVHVIFAKLIHKLLCTICRSCGRILLTNKKIGEYSAKIEDLKKRLDTVPHTFYDNVMKDAKKTQECPHCGAKRYSIEHIKPTSYHEIIDGGAMKLFPSAVRERLERITDEDLRLFGINSQTARPEWAILQVMPVAPVTVRPSITLESGIRSEDDLTHKLVDIIRINQKLREARESGVPVNIIQELHDLLQYHVTTYFDNEVSGLPPARHRSGRALKTICQRLKGKEGRFRGNLSGKRVDFSARTVISPDPNLDINEVGVPVDVATRLTVPEKVTPWNIESMRKMVEKGPDEYPGALYIVRPDGRRIRLEFVIERSSIAQGLEPGFIVERHIRDGDIVLFNRQPSLHRMSIMAHKVRVLPHKTFRLNPCVCPPYNADFDGDEMNLHVLQGEEARTEATLLMQVQDQILSPRYGGPIIGAVTDHLTASYLLTKDGTWLNKNEVCRLLVASGYNGPMPKPDKTKPEPLWSGKTMFSLFIPKDLNFVLRSNICRKCSKCKEEKCAYDSYIVVKNGVLRSGVIDRNAIGKEKSDSLFHRIVKDYGAEKGRVFLDSISRLLDRFITMRGFSYAIDDLDLPHNVREKISKAIQEAEERVGELVQKYRNGKLERLPGQSLEESLEIYIMNELSSARDEAGNIADEYLGMNSSGAIMARVGAKGSMLNVAQMTACVGQQSIRGKRILRGYRGRTLSFFEPGDVGAESRGFVYASFGSGLNPKEFFFHSMGGREGLVDTAVRTQQSGYMQRRVINALEHVRVEYDGTVRDSKGSIIQFRYGEDGVDTAKSDHGRAVNVERLIESVRLGSSRGTRMSKSAIVRAVQDKSSQLSPLLVDELKKYLTESGLTKKAVDEVIDKSIDNYGRSQIEPGEAAGIVSAQSIGEPGTQMTLRTFHYAGVREQNVTLGLPRLIEIVDARKIPSTPIMIVYLDKKHKSIREKAEEVAAQLTHTTLGDIAQSIESEITKSRFLVTLDPQKARDRDVSAKDIKDALQQLDCETDIGKTQITIKTRDLEVAQFKRLASKISSLRVKGLPAVKRALVVEEDEEWIIRTEGSALSLALSVKGVDPTRTISNSIHEVGSVLGIEAARSVIVKEAMSVLEEQGLDVDIRHIMLLADAMTSTGEVLQVGRHGISGEKASTLAKAAFEITIPTIVDAAMKGISDKLKGVAENVIVGQQVPMGTGLIDVYMSNPGAKRHK